MENLRGLCHGEGWFPGALSPLLMVWFLDLRVAAENQGVFVPRRGMVPGALSPLLRVSFLSFRVAWEHYVMFLPAARILFEGYVDSSASRVFFLFLRVAPENHGGEGLFRGVDGSSLPDRLASNKMAIRFGNSLPRTVFW